ncbi:NUDIX hydrolase [Cereibacter sphaeroides]|uniref:NUDIX hydrolase n=1 Tax=Cereibacter sphaeroides TaxID=1063 RepID=UPI001F3F833E|nr:NUDIX hydrolase [Cereibacter sphaeroides]MCE6952144.1 NUDIX hydrolase [Cereibacter sphaeroides]
MDDGQFGMAQDTSTGTAAAPAATRAQCGAVCWRAEGGKVLVLLITSRDTGRWVIPKGGRIEGLDDAESAAQEAWEEAGIRGEVDHRPLGRFSYRKLLKTSADVLCDVAVFPLRVSEMLDAFPERGQRKRKWFSPDKAARKVAEPELREILLHFAPERAGTPDSLPLRSH